MRSVRRHRALGFRVKVPSTWARSCAASPGVTCASSTASARAPGAGLGGRCRTGDGPPPSTRLPICETFGLKKEGAATRLHARRGYTLLAVAAGTGDVLMARLREGRANTSVAQHLPARDHRSGPPCRCQRAAHRPRRLGLLRPRRGGDVPQLEVRFAPIRQPGACARSSRPPRGRLDPHPLLARRRRRRGRDRLHPVRRPGGCGAGAAHRAAGEADPGLPAGPPHAL